MSALRHVPVSDTWTCRVVACVPNGVASLRWPSSRDSVRRTSRAVELALSTRNHGLPLEALRYDLTPVGLHYLLIHFDIPQVDAETWRLEVGGEVRNPLSLSLAELRERPQVSVACTLECAGNGRARLTPRPLSQPWLEEAVGNAEWTGTPLAPLLEEAGIEDGAVEVLFTGLDRGIQGEIEHAYERSLRVEDALRPELLLAYEVNGQPLPPQHGFPLRLIVPGWYGMTHVKWLERITVLSEPFEGYQQAMQYREKQSEDDPGIPVERMLPRSLMIPPGIPDFPDRKRFLEPGPVRPRRPRLVGARARHAGRGERRRRANVGRRDARRASR